MLEVWDHALQANTVYQRDIYLINDLEEAWNGPVEIFFESDGQLSGAITLDLSAGGFQRSIGTLNFTTPPIPGTYDMVAEIDYQGEKVRSVRAVNILPGNGSPSY